jgi:hypothetical protein
MHRCFKQLVGTPLHLLGLDFYNRPTLPLGTRVWDALRNSAAPIGARMVPPLLFSLLSCWVFFYYYFGMNFSFSIY